MKNVLMAMLVMLSASASAQVRSYAEIKKSGVIRIANDGDYAPFYSGVTGDMEGFEIDLGNEIFKRLDMKVNWVKDDFDALFSNMGRGKYDVIMASMTVTPQRQRLADFSTPEYCTGIVVVSKKNPLNKVEDIRNMPVSVLRGSTFDQFAKDNSLIRAKRYPSMSAARSAVAFGGELATLDDEVTALNWANSPVGKKLDFKVGQPITKDKIAIAMPKGQDELREAINATMAKVMADGTYSKLVKKWLPKDLRCK